MRTSIKSKLLAVTFAALGLSACGAAGVLGVLGGPSTTIAGACAQSLDVGIINSCVVAAGKLWRGAAPTVEGAATLANLGVKSIVNLELIFDDRGTFESSKPAVSLTTEIQYFRLRDWEPLVVLAPSILDETVAKFIALTRSAPLPLYVHCRSGQNRTGVMVAAYRVFNGMPIEEAIAEMGRYKGIWFDSDAVYIRTLTADRRALLEPKINAAITSMSRYALIKCAQGACVVGP